MGFLSKLFGKGTAYTDMDAIQGHIEKHVGPVEMVFHEIVSDRIHLDVIHIAPTEERPYHFLCTMGMSALNMPRADGSVKRCELCIVLEPEWPVSQEGFQDEANYWPVRVIKTWARMPFQMKFAMRPFLSGAVDEDPNATFDGSDYNAVYFVPPAMFQPAFGLMYVPEASVQFLQVMPLMKAETEFKAGQIEPDALWKRFESIDPNELLITKKRRESFI